MAIGELQRMGSEDEDEDVMDSEVLKGSMQFIIRSDYEARESTLLHFFGVLGYD